MTVQRRAKEHKFVVTPYRAGADGTLEPELPTEGVCAGQDRRPCKLNINHRRKRSTGPCFPLTVMRCRPHRRAFTLYPPGHVPYGRIGVAAVAPDGSPIHGQDGAERYGGTLFEASVDAAEQKAWHREHLGSSTDRWWGTQLRRLMLAAQLLAVAPGVASRRREKVAEILCIDLLLLCEQAQKMRAAQGYQQRGAAIRKVLDALPQSRFLPERLLECGYLAGCWGAPHRWLPQSASLRRRPFRAAGTQPGTGTQPPYRPP